MTSFLHIDRAPRVLMNWGKKEWDPDDISREKTVHINGYILMVL